MAKAGGIAGAIKEERNRILKLGYKYNDSGSKENEVIDILSDYPWIADETSANGLGDYTVTENASTGAFGSADFSRQTVGSFTKRNDIPYCFVIERESATNAAFTQVINLINTFTEAASKAEGTFSEAVDMIGSLFGTYKPQPADTQTINEDGTLSPPPSSGDNSDSSNSGSNPGTQGKPESGGNTESGGTTPKVRTFAARQTSTVKTKSNSFAPVAGSNAPRNDGSSDSGNSKPSGGGNFGSGGSSENGTTGSTTPSSGSNNGAVTPSGGTTTPQQGQTTQQPQGQTQTPQQGQNQSTTPNDSSGDPKESEKGDTIKALKKGASAIVNSLISYLKKIAGQVGNFDNLMAGNNLNSEIFLPFRYLYITKETKKKYVFPLASKDSSFSTINNTWSDPRGGKDDKENWLTKTIDAGFKAVKGLSNVVNTTSNLIANLRGEASALNFEAEVIKTFRYNTNGDSVSVAFTLYNTTRLNAWKDNFKFLYLFSLRNLPFRIDAMTYIPPLLYDIIIPGVKRLPVSYVKSLNINPIGMTRTLSCKNFIGSGDIIVNIPEAWEVSISFENLLGRSANMMLSELAGNLNIETSVSTQSSK